MNLLLYEIDEISEKIGIQADLIREWIKKGIVFPEGYAGDREPLLSEENLKTIEKIGSLLELGYDSDGIKKIIKKVGLPKTEGKSGKSSGNEKYLTVGNLAEKTGVSARTIKHWEEKGIIEPDLRSAGGFRLYRDYYILFCNLIRDLQLFGYSLEEIKKISDYFRSFVELKNDPGNFSTDDVDNMIQTFEKEIALLFEKTEMLKKGIKRWEDLLRKQKKQLTAIRETNKKRQKEGE